MRIFAVDGTSLDLPNVKALDKYFGRYKGYNTDSTPRAQVSVLYDCLNQVTYDSTIAPVYTSETPLAEDHIDNITFPDSSLITFDRGYHDSFLRIKLTLLNIDYCMRQKSDENIIKEFIESQENDRVVTVKPNRNCRQKCLESNIQAQSYKVRLIKVPLDSGQIEILATSLMDKELDISFFKELYFLRWGVEENYKVIKTRVGIEKFIGQTPLAIKQEFYARMLMLNITSLIRNIAEPSLTEKLNESKKELTHEYKINFKAALSKMRRNGLKLFFEDIKETIRKLISSFIQSKSLVRKNRKFERYIRRSSKSHYHQNYSGI